MNYHLIQANYENDILTEIHALKSKMKFIHNYTL